MARYETAFKLKVVKNFLAGDGDAETVSPAAVDPACYAWRRRSW